MPYVELRLDGDGTPVLRAKNGDVYPCKNQKELWESVMWIADSDDASNQQLPAVVDPHAQQQEERQVIVGEVVTDEEIEAERREQLIHQSQDGVPIPDLGDPVSNYAAQQAVKAAATSGRFLKSLSFRGRSAQRQARMRRNSEK